MRNLLFELHKIKREIIVHGDVYDFHRIIKDEYGESTEQAEYVLSTRGLFHTEKGYVSKSVTDGTYTHTKGTPKLLVVYECSEKIENGDIVAIGKNKYIVIEKNNIEMFDIVTDISLELIVDGIN
uniref:Uncharacterized protein n=1 Tax=Dulem virus 36 TaxID=3145754 RepID=A0AAU8AYD5_9CAUD